LGSISKVKPLCEQALGKTLNGDITVKVHGRLATGFILDVWRPLKEAFTTPLSDRPVADILFRSLTVAFLPAWFAIRGISGLSTDSIGRSVAKDNILYLFPKSKALIGTSTFDYFIAHEIIRLLTFGMRDARDIYGVSLYEGFATYYGGKVTTQLHPDFNVLTVETRRACIEGYQTVVGIADATGTSPYHAMKTTPPRVDEPWFDYVNRLQAAQSE
jgi:hypothetical protein